MPDAVAIRPATAADAAAVAGLITELGYPTTTAEMAGRLGTSVGANSAALVAVAGGVVAGFAGVILWPSFVHNGPSGHVVSFVVAERSRRHGIGRALLAAAEAWLRARNVDRVTVVSANRRDDAHAFYRACGYDHTGLRFVKALK